MTFPPLGPVPVSIAEIQPTSASPAAVELMTIEQIKSILLEKIQILKNENVN